MTSLQTVERIAVDGHPLHPGDRLAHLLFEQGEQELVLAVEVLVEAAQRLLRAVDHLLHGELGRALLADDLAGRVQELLHPHGRALTCRAGRALDGTIAPDGVVRFRIIECLGVAIGGRVRHTTRLIGSEMVIA